MSKTIKKEEVVNNSNQPQQRKKNIDFLLNKIRTFEIFSEDFEGIWDVEYLKKCLEKLQTDEFYIERCLISTKERIETIEHIEELEEEIKELKEEIKEVGQTIIDKEEFIEKCCDTDEEDILMDIDTLREDLEELWEQLNELKTVKN